MILHRKILLAGFCCVVLVLSFINPVMAENETGLKEESAVTITDHDKEIMSFLRGTGSGDWHNAKLSNPGIYYEGGMEMYFVNEQPMYILKGKLSGGGLPDRETVVTSGKNEVAVSDFLTRVNNGEITKVKSISYSRNKSNGMLVATEIVIK